jgi:ArsR family transcriptional regulator
MATRFKALADPVRLQLLSSVASHAGGEACVCDISVGVEVSQPTISHHLKVLREAGLLTSQRRASWMYYAVVPEALNALSMLLSVHADTAPALGTPA